MSRVTIVELREAAHAAEAALIDAFGSEHRGALRQASERAAEALAKIDDLVTNLLDTL